MFDPIAFFVSYCLSFTFGQGSNKTESGHVGYLLFQAHVPMAESKVNQSFKPSSLFRPETGALHASGVSCSSHTFEVYNETPLQTDLNNKKLINNVETINKCDIKYLMCTEVLMDLSFVG